MARWFSTSRRRLGVGVAGVFLAAAAAGCATPYVSGSGGSGGQSGVSSSEAEIVIVCESGTVTKDGVYTSSSVAFRVPAGSPIPPGCRAA